MIDLKLLRENFAEVSKLLLSRNVDLSFLEAILELDEKHRYQKRLLAELNNRRNLLSKQISKLLLTNQQDEIKLLQAEIIKIKENLAVIQTNETTIDKELTEKLFLIPNVPFNVPIGKSEQDNKVIYVRGAIPTFNFPVLPHWELAKQNALIDFEKGVSISGPRFVVYQGKGAKLLRALIDFTLEQHINKGYLEQLPPVIVNQKALFNTGQLPKFIDDLFQINDHFFLSPTSEVQLVNLFANRIFEQEELPVKVCANTVCFRSEAGNGGRDIRGVIRLHQFYKTELVKICEPQNSFGELESLVHDAESILENLSLPYRRVELCSGDLGFGSAKTYDLEVWLPSFGTYREISSCSNMTDFQSRRSLIRYRDGKNQKPVLLHTINGSGLAIDRLIAAIIENYQTFDGKIKVPNSLKRYFVNQEYL